METNIQQSMIIISSLWGNSKTFTLMPARSECPYNEAIYDPDLQTLAIISKEKKETFKVVDRLDDNGDPVPAKKPTTDRTNKTERKLLETYYEYYIKDKEEIKAFVKMFAINAGNFNVDQYLMRQAA